MLEQLEQFLKEKSYRLINSVLVWDQGSITLEMVTAAGDLAVRVSPYSQRSKKS